MKTVWPIVIGVLFGMVLYSGLGRLAFGPRAQAQESRSFEQQCSAPMFRLQEREVQALERIAATLDKIERQKRN
jgi:hypothetical protein